MSVDYSFSIPNIANYEIKYYFHNSSNKQNARIFPHHVHDRLEFYILLEGDASFSVQSNLYNLSKGDIVFTKPNEMHNCILNSNSLHNHACFWFDCSSQFLFSDFLTHDFGENNLIRPDSEHLSILDCVYKNIQCAGERGDKQELFYLTLQMLSIFRKFIVTDAPKKVLPERLKHILSDIDLNFKQIHNLSYLTNKYFISQSTLNRLFQTYLHTTPKQYLETKRLAYSRRLLKNGESVLSACLQSGFTDYSNYIRLFRKRFNITPKQYQES